MSLDLPGSLSSGSLSSDSLTSGSDNLTDDIAESVGDAVASLVKTALDSFISS